MALQKNVFSNEPTLIFFQIKALVINDNLELVAEELVQVCQIEPYIVVS